MLDIRYSTKFKRDYKTVIRRGYNPQCLQDVIEILCSEQSLPLKYKDHNLTGNYIDHRECYIIPDWLLIYKIEQEILTLSLNLTGSIVIYFEPALNFPKLRPIYGGFQPIECYLPDYEWKCKNGFNEGEIKYYC